MNVREHRYYPIQLLIVLAVNLFFVGQAAFGNSTAKEREGLIGPVRSVTVALASFMKDSGQWVEGPRRLYETTSFDKQGNEIEKTIYHMADNSILHIFKSILTYDVDGKLRESVSVSDGSPTGGKTIYLYDEQGRLSEEAFYENGKPTGTKETYIYDTKKAVTRKAFYRDGSLLRSMVYAYDSKGNVVEESVYERNATIPTDKYRYAYDSQGRRTETVTYAPAGFRAFIDVYTYNAQGYLIEKNVSHADGSLLRREVMTYDTKGNKIKEAFFIVGPSVERDRVGCIHGCIDDEVRTYEYDSVGNWIKKSVFAKGGAEPSQVTYRAITYYSSAGDNQ